MPSTKARCLYSASLRQRVFSETKKLVGMKRAGVLIWAPASLILSDFLESGCILPRVAFTPIQESYAGRTNPFRYIT